MEAITGSMSTEELEWIAHTSGMLPANSVVVEVGTMYGRSAAAWCAGAGQDKIVICVDTWKGTPSFAVPGGPHEMYLNQDVLAVFQSNMRERGYTPGILVMDSRKAAALFGDQSLDAVFLDDDHFQIQQSIKAWSPKVKAGGLLCGHDWGRWGITEAVDYYFSAVDLPVGTIWCVRMED